MRYLVPIPSFQSQLNSLGLIVMAVNACSVNEVESQPLL